ncbi:unannotated protein [freshwater metagenome]|uniref:Unannotated protein n=1 Tax=freshwater metagenome TaxID=449393 RepID=A0A6J6BPX6_9ZZZZ
METNKQHPELYLSDSLVQHLAGHLWVPEIDSGKHRKDHGSEDHVVEVRHDEVAVTEREIKGWAGENHSG